MVRCALTTSLRQNVLGAANWTCAVSYLDAVAALSTHFLPSINISQAPLFCCFLAFRFGTSVARLGAHTCYCAFAAFSSVCDSLLGRGGLIVFDLRRCAAVFVPACAQHSPLSHSRHFDARYSRIHRLFSLSGSTHLFAAPSIPASFSARTYAHRCAFLAGNPTPHLAPPHHISITPRPHLPTPPWAALSRTNDLFLLTTWLFGDVRLTPTAALQPAPHLLVLDRRRRRPTVIYHHR